MRSFVIGFLVGLFLAVVLSQPAVAQTAMRMFGTTSSGTARAILVDTSGNVQVGVQ
jgi:hypothetical protein